MFISMSHYTYVKVLAKCNKIMYCRGAAPNARLERGQIKNNTFYSIGKLYFITILHSFDTINPIIKLICRTSPIIA